MIRYVKFKDKYGTLQYGKVLSTKDNIVKVKLNSLFHVYIHRDRIINKED